MPITVISSSMKATGVSRIDNSAASTDSPGFFSSVSTHLFIASPNNIASST